MRRLKGFLAPCALAALLLWMLARPQIALSGATDGLSLWAVHVLPALLPYYILTQMLIGSGALARLGRTMGGLVRAPFRLPGSAAPSLLLAYLSGAPSAARIAGQLCDAGDFTPDEALRFTAVGALTGPVFMAGTAGGLLGDTRAGPAILCACLIAALANGLVWRFWGAPPLEKKAPAAAASPVLQSLPGAVTGGCAAMMAIGAVIALSCMLLALMEDSGALAAAASALSPVLGGQGTALAVLRGLVEMTGGVRAAAALALPPQEGVALASALCSFGGLAVAVQAAVFLGGAVPLRLYLLQRCTQGILGLLASLALRPLFFPEVTATASASAFCPWCLLLFFLALGVTALFWHMLRRARPRPCPPPRNAAWWGEGPSMFYRGRR